MTELHDNRFTLKIYLAIVVLIIFLVGIQFTTYADRNYRQDELNTIHAAHLMSPQEITIWMATNIHPPFWRLLADKWIDVFGNAEPVARWLSVIATLLTFSILFRLGTDLLDWRLGILAIIIFGVYPPLANFLNELRPYPYLILWVTTLHLFFLRWLNQQRYRYMLGYVIFGMIAIYTHYYAIYVFIAHFVFIIVTTRRMDIIWTAIMMWTAIGLSFLAWVVPFVHGFTVRQSGGIYYALPNQAVGLQLLYERLTFMPETIGQVLFITGISAPMFFALPPKRNHLRWTTYHAVIFPVISLVSILITAWIANLFIGNVTDRNMTIILPTVVLLMALGIRSLPKPVHLIIAIVLLVGLQGHLTTNTSNGPYREIINAISTSYQPDSILITEFETAWQWLLPASYALMDFAPVQMKKQNMLHLIDTDDRAHSPGPPDRLVNIYSAISVEQLNNFAMDTQQLWHLREGNGNYHSNFLQMWLNTNYAKLRTIQWIDNTPTPYTLVEYRRVPDSSNLMLVAGDILELLYWKLNESVVVNPCQTITVDNFWQTTQSTDNPLQLNIILANDEGQVAISQTFPSASFTTEWQPDTYYYDSTPLTIPCDIRTGNYNLLLGIQDSITGEALSLTYPDGNEIGTLFYLTTLNAEDNE